MTRKVTATFECGFSEFEYSRASFSIRFFFLLLLFILFDVELTLLLQLPFLVCLSRYSNIIGLIFFLVILILATFEEWRRGLFGWKIEIGYIRLVVFKTAGPFLRFQCDIWL